MILEALALFAIIGGKPVQANSISFPDAVVIIECRQNVPRFDPRLTTRELRRMGIRDNRTVFVCDNTIGMPRPLNNFEARRRIRECNLRPERCLVIDRRSSY